MDASPVSAHHQKLSYHKKIKSTILFDFKVKNYMKGNAILN